MLREKLLENPFSSLSVTVRHAELLKQTSSPVK